MTKKSTQIYRIVQEAVANAIKHGKPSRILIELTLGGRPNRPDGERQWPRISRRNSAKQRHGNQLHELPRLHDWGDLLAVRRDPNGGTCRYPVPPEGLHARIRNDS